MGKKIFIYVQHLLGAGHLVRMMSLAEELAKYQYEVLLVSGGLAIKRVVADYHYLQLPPVKALNGDFTQLVDSEQNPINDRWRSARVTKLLKAVVSFKPDLVITESFPFARRAFSFELNPLIKWIAAQSEIKLIASIRDILQGRTHRENIKTVATIRQYYDGVLVHGDEKLIVLDTSFPLTNQIHDKIHYTGYIYSHSVPHHSSICPDGFGEVIISGGSGTMSAKLLETVQQAKSLSAARTRVWRLLSGNAITSLPRIDQDSLILEQNRVDFPLLLKRCALSVSQAGYNTTLDILVSGARSLMIPFTGIGETEQHTRAKLLARIGRVVMLQESNLRPETLATAIDCTIDSVPRQVAIKLDGAMTSVNIIAQYLQ